MAYGLIIWLEGVKNFLMDGIAVVVGEFSAGLNSKRNQKPKAGE